MSFVSDKRAEEHHVPPHAVLPGLWRDVFFTLLPSTDTPQALLWGRSKFFCRLPSRKPDFSRTAARCAAQPLPRHAGPNRHAGGPKRPASLPPEPFRAALYVEKTRNASSSSPEKLTCIALYDKRKGHLFLAYFQLSVDFLEAKLPKCVFWQGLADNFF